MYHYIPAYIVEIPFLLQTLVFISKSAPPKKNVTLLSLGTFVSYDFDPGIPGTSLQTTVKPSRLFETPTRNPNPRLRKPRTQCLGTYRDPTLLTNQKTFGFHLGFTFGFLLKRLVVCVAVGSGHVFNQHH